MRTEVPKAIHNFPSVKACRTEISTVFYSNTVYLPDYCIYTVTL